MEQGKEVVQDGRVPDLPHGLDDAQPQVPVIRLQGPDQGVHCLGAHGGQRPGSPELDCRIAVAEGFDQPVDIPPFGKGIHVRWSTGEEICDTHPWPPYIGSSLGMVRTARYVCRAIREATEYWSTVGIAGPMASDRRTTKVEMIWKQMRPHQAPR